MDATTALTELAQWAQPGRRADLIAQAWRAGATNISELSRVARISRDTVYGDLAELGIDYRERQEPFMHTPITLFGYTGGARDNEIEAAEIGRGAEEAERRRGWMASAVARYHNGLVDLANEHAQTRQEMTAALTMVDHLFEALSSAPTDRWLATHHRWLVAYAAADGPLRTWKDAYARFFNAWDQAARNALSRDDFYGFYAEHVEEANRIYRPEEDPYKVISRTEQEHQARLEIAAQTARHLAAADG